MNLGIKIYGILVAVVAIVALCFGISAYVQQVPVDSNGDIKFGASGNMVAEDYIPYVMYNDGYNSAKDIKTSANLSAAAGTFTGAMLFSGAITASSGLNVSAGDTFANNFVQGGAATAVTVSTTAQTDVPNTLSAAQICDQSYLPITPGNTTTPHVKFPTAAALYADCLTTNGDTKSVYFYNTSGVTSTLFIVNTSGTLMFASTTDLGTDATLMAGDGAMVTFVRTALATMQILINQFSP
jgi:hypothetical protein